MIRIRKLHPEAQIPSRGTELSVGYDVYAIGDYIIYPNETGVIETGIALELPEGLECQIRSRSGLAIGKGLIVVNSPGTIDPDYRGEIKVGLHNLSKHKLYVKHGERIAQMVFAKYETVQMEVLESLSDTERGHGGLGSTGT